MSFNRLLYDSCERKKNIVEAQAPGLYQLNTPVVCGSCLEDNPSIRMQKGGVSMNSGVEWRFFSGPVDVESDLRNINRPASRCPEPKFNPECNDCDVTNQGQPCGQGVVKSSINNKKNLTAPWKMCGDSDLIDFPRCYFPTEETRSSNPACNLRGTGINRFVPLCLDPQKQISFPGDYQVPTRLIVKDNHRPCVPTPNVNSMIPAPRRQPCPETTKTCANYTGAMYQFDVCG